MKKKELRKVEIEVAIQILEKRTRSLRNEIFRLYVLVGILGVLIISLIFK